MTILSDAHRIKFQSRKEIIHRCLENFFLSSVSQKRSLHQCPRGTQGKQKCERDMMTVIHRDSLSLPSVIKCLSRIP